MDGLVETPPLSSLDGLLARLRGRIGAGHVLTDPNDLASASCESRGVYRGSALAVVRPGDTQEVAFAVEECARAGVPIVPQGGNTGLVGGGVPFEAVALSLARMNRIRDIDVLDGVMIVEAGCILQVVREAAEAAGALFPLSLPSEGSCRIGGNLSTNAGGINVLRYGNARELVLGLEVVLPDGRIWNGLSRLRKDNTGYDLKNLFVGAEGTLGIITAAVLKLHPLPRTRVTAFVGCGSAALALRFFGDMRREAGDSLSAFEFMPRAVLDMVLANVPGAVRPLSGDHEAYALVELTSPRDDSGLRDIALDICGRALDAGTIADATMAASEAQRSALWMLRERLWEAQQGEGASIKHDVSVPVSRIAEFLHQAEGACRAELPGVKLLGFGHFGDGNIHFNVGQPDGMEAAAFVARTGRFNTVVHDIAVALGGSISAEHGIGLTRRDELARYKDPVALDLMGRIKGVLDPAGLMNPGKVLASPGDRSGGRADPVRSGRRAGVSPAALGRTNRSA